MPMIRRCRHFGCHNPAYVPNWFCREHMDEQQAFINRRDEFKNDRQKKYNETKRTATPIKREQQSFYRSKQWQSLRHEVLTKQHYLCQYCLANKRVTSANIVDHIVPIVFDPKHKDDIDNLATICVSCHYLKTKWEENYYNSASGISHNNVDAITNIDLIDYLMNNLNKFE